MTSRQQAPATLSPSNYPGAVALLCARDAALGAMVQRWGVPPFWVHPRGFAGLTLAILAQLVSLESAHGTYRKLRAAVPELTPAAFQSLDDVTLRRAGCSRPKISYLRQIASDLLSGELDLDALDALADEAVRQRLQQLRGVGRWTADSYLLFSLRRADAWPAGDLALEKTMADAQATLPPLLTAEANRRAEHWRPWRAVAARILWSQYLHVRGRFERVSQSWADVELASSHCGHK